MEYERLLEALAQPAAYPFPVDHVEVRHTHISVVFLAGERVYKLKKPVRLGFLDFTDLDRRRYFCEEEVRLNRRLAPHVYRGVVPVCRMNGAPRFEGDGEPMEWAVAMERLPEEATGRERLLRGQLDAGAVEALGRRIAEFHGNAQGGPEIAAYGGFDAVARNARENFEQSAAQVGVTISAAVFERLQNLIEAELGRLERLIAARAERGVPCDTHGDLRLDHVYFFPDRSPPEDLVIIDCIEFNSRFRYADPVADLAFLAMDLHFQGRADLARSLADAYFAAAGDAEGRELLSFYTAYRAAVRGKVEGMELTEQEIPEAERVQALHQSRAHWLLALGTLSPPAERPCLLLVAGLPGSGKSTLARALAERAGFTVIRSDVVRKELARSSQELYAPEWTERTYAECLRRAEGRFFEGGRVLIDATFQDDRRRREFLEAARRWAIPALCIVCRADPEIVRQRLNSRRGDVSDADWHVYQFARQHWQAPGPDVEPYIREIDTGGDLESALSRVWKELAVAQLAVGN